ncbi:MAG: TRAP transporter permease [Lachnospiraceae bacterium]|nr:TRAP transporter permease [Lachnospiraceae bacterium]
MEKAKKINRYIVYAAGVLMSIFQIYSAIVGRFIPGQQRGVHLAFALLLVTFLYPPKLKNEKLSLAISYILAAIGVACALFIAWEFRADYQLILVRKGPSQTDIIIGTILIICILISVLLATGKALPIIAAVFILYGMFGHLLPGMLYHQKYKWKVLVDTLCYSTEGIFGSPLGVSATYVAMFVLFGSFLSVTGCGQWFIDIAYALTGHTRSGPAMTAVVSSAAMGTISGTGVANVVTTGSFTIPLMKKIGYDPVFAGAVEAVASTGGQIMPPVMGAGAFILAEILGISYGEVTVAALIPAILYFVACGVQVHFEACRLGLKGMPKDQLPKAGKTFVEGIPFLIPIGLLIWALVVARYSASYSGLISIACIVVVCFLLRTGDKRMKVKDVFDALADGAKGMVPVAMACSTAGIIIGILTRTGLTLRFTSIVLTVANGRLLPALILTMLSCILLGMGLPTTAAFIVCATLCAPALVKMGISSMAAYMFVFYYACLSSITPPVAMAAYAAAGISGASAFKTGLYATRLGIGGFIVPFFFCYNQGLLMQGSAGNIVLVGVSALLGVIVLGIGMEGFFMKKMNVIERILLIAAAIAMVYPGTLTDIIGLAVAVAILALNFINNKRAQHHHAAEA